MRIIYIPLEPYTSRYTLQLGDWNEAEFKRIGVEYLIVDGLQLSNNCIIKTGAVLDAHGRSYFAMSQIMTLVKMLSENVISSDDFIFFEDMFHPGIESLAYIFDQQFTKNTRPKIGVRCLAQTIDPDDFTHYTNMAKWMRMYENMLLKFIDVVFAASFEMLTFMTAAGWDIPVAVTGLPFGKREVVSRVSSIRPFEERKNRVVFASRIVAEKQPEFFIAVAAAVRSEMPDVEFAFLSGLAYVNYPDVDKAESSGIVRVHKNLEKNQYYEMLNDSKVLFNCAWQDWVSNTISEADALGCNLVFPAYRSFPETLFNQKQCLYIPWSISDASNHVCQALEAPSSTQGAVSTYQDKSIYRTVQYIEDIFNSDYINLLNPSDPVQYRQRTKNNIK